jgi:Immunoglobulin I-set domain
MANISFIKTTISFPSASRYRWIKNGKPFQFQTYDDRMQQQFGRGSLIVTKPRDEDLGQYQCFAENEFGIATSNSVFVRKAELNAFKDEPPKVSIQFDIPNWEQFIPTYINDNITFHTQLAVE